MLFCLPLIAYRSLLIAYRFPKKSVIPSEPRSSESRDNAFAFAVSFSKLET